MSVPPLANILPEPCAARHLCSGTAPNGGVAQSAPKVRGGLCACSTATSCRAFLARPVPPCLYTRRADAKFLPWAGHKGGPRSLAGPLQAVSQMPQVSFRGFCVAVFASRMGLRDPDGFAGSKILSGTATLGCAPRGISTSRGEAVSSMLLAEIVEAKPVTAWSLAVVLGDHGDSLVPFDLVATPHLWRVH